MKKSNMNRFLSLVLSVALVWSLLAANVSNLYAADMETSSLNVTSLFSKSVPDAPDAEAIDYSDLLTFDPSVLLDYSESKSIRQEKDSPDPDSEIAYIESVIESLATPVGAVGFDASASSAEMVDVIVWLQELPKALAAVYGEDKLEKAAPFNALGVQARASIQSAHSSSITFEYKDVFSGFAMKATMSDVQMLADMPGVFAVVPDELMYADEAVLDPDYKFAGMGDSRDALRIGEIHSAGITGKDIVVGVLDTGIDYNHPDFQGVYAGGWNFIVPGSDLGRPAEYAQTPMETTYVQWQVSGQDELNSNNSSYYTSHGTHVCGTIAAQALNDADANKTLGIAPDVQLYVARVLGPYGSGATSVTIAAMEDFSSDGGNLPKADVINLSLGSDTDTAYAANVFALNNVVIAGVNVAVSAGNNAGANAAARKALTLGIPGTAYLPVTVAASQYGGVATLTYDAVTAGSATFGLSIEGYTPNNTFGDNAINGTPAPVNVDGKGYEAYLAFGPNDTNPTLEQLQAIPDGSLAGKILVVKRGLSFTDFLAQALRTKAGALIVVNNAANGEAYVSNMAIGGMKEESLPILSAYHSTSAKLTAAAGEATIYLNLGNLTKKQLPYEPAYFSSIGPVTETTGLKPDIIAPGYNIRSTQPGFIVNADHNPDKYTIAVGLKSGTSMSAPHIAGILALMKQKYPDASPAEIKARLMNTSDPDLIKALPDGTQASVFEVGAGFVNPYRAIMEETGMYITVKDDIPGQTEGKVIENQTLSSLSFGSVKSGSTRKIPVTLNNSINTLPISLHNASASSITVEYNNNTRYSNNASANGIEVKYSGMTDNTFEVWVEVPAGAEEGTYEGRLLISESGKTYVVPWAVRVGDVPVTFGFDFVSDRPVVSTNPAIGSDANSSAASLYFWWKGSWNTGKTNIYLIDMATGKQAYYYGTLTVGTEYGPGTWKILNNVIGSTAYPIVNNAVVPVKETVKDGAYKIAMTVGSSLYRSSGLVFSSVRPTLTLNENVLISDKPEVTSVTVSGNIYSPAMELAKQNGFTWEGTYYVTDETDRPVDQSWNVLAFDSVTGIGDVIMKDTIPFICDANGNFQLTFTGVTQKDKEQLAYLFTSGSNHTVVGVEAYWEKLPLVGSTTVMYGGAKSGGVTPRLKSDPTIPLVACLDTPLVNAFYKSSTDSIISVSGWALYSSNGTKNDISSVNVYLDGSLLGSASYIERPDVEAAVKGYPDYSKAGFVLDIPASLLLDDWYEIAVKVSTTDGKSATFKRIVTISKDAPLMPYVGFIDTPAASAKAGVNTVEGWALCSTDGENDSINKIEVFVDDKSVGVVTNRYSRPDVAEAILGYGDYSKCGYSLDVDFSGLKGKHTVTVKAFNGTTLLGSTDKVVVIE